MQHIAPLGNVYQAGTLSGNPIAMIAGYTLLQELKNTPSVYADLESIGSQLETGIHEVLAAKQIPHRINRFGSMISLHFCEHPVIDFESASRADISLFNRLFHHMLENGIFLPPSAYESWFLSHALTTQDLDQTLAALDSFVV